MMDKYLEAQKRLAELRGWTNIEDAGGALVGTPPDGAHASRGQAMVPQWCSDWNACGPLMVEYGCYPSEEPDALFGVPRIWVDAASYSAPIADHPSRDVAVMHSIVLAVTAKIDAQIKSPGARPGQK